MANRDWFIEVNFRIIALPQGTYREENPEAMARDALIKTTNQLHESQAENRRLLEELARRDGQIMELQKDTQARKLPDTTFVSREANISLGLTLALAAVQAMNVVPTFVAAVCWVGVFLLVLDVIWRGNAHRKNWVKLTFTICLAVSIAALFYRSIVGSPIPTGTVEVYFGDKQRMKGTTVPFVDVDQLTQAMPKLVAKAGAVLLPVSPIQGKWTVSVIIRNTSSIPIRNATITIISNHPIKGETNGARPFSDNEVSYEKRELKPFKRLGEEYFMSISFVPTSPFDATGLLVTVDADNIKPHASAARFAFIPPPPQ